MSRLLFISFTVLLFLNSCAGQPLRNTASVGDSRSRLVVFMSDFGLQDDGVAICKGVMLSEVPDLQIVDLTHEVPAFSVKDAGRFLANTTPFYPSGTVFLVLVEKHTDKPVKPIVAKSKRGQYFVLPDNGLLSLVSEREGILEIREIKEGSWVKGKGISSTFLGRDLYSPVAARIARGENWEGVGPKVEKPFTLSIPMGRAERSRIVGEVVALEGAFGNLITNITVTSFLESGYSLGESVGIEVGTLKMQLPFVKTFEDVPVDSALLYVDSTDHVGIAINQGNFAKKFKVRPPTRLVISKKVGKK